ncbi:hypothetical protein JTE90_025461 [Oedothorax gibbosus]|uniref:CRAL-TRIO domain-containing protein n=1 Tax=Oedothorax gibbosus TaxID=931172 RepID=A0AAV6U4J4_9ARAC|nr:hypothetical protein JTE90_025461 [Oedothorax gibbosus]
MPSDSPAPVVDFSSCFSSCEKRKDKKEASSDNDHLPYHLWYLPEEFRQMAEKELKETDEKKEKALKKLKQLLAAEKNLYIRTDDKYLLGYLRGKKFDVDRAMKMIKNAFKLRTKKKFYDSEDNAIVHDVFRQNFIGFLPYRAKNGSVIMVVKVGLWDPEKVDRDLLMWTVTHCMIHSIEDEATQVAGYSAIIDVRGVGNRHLKMLTVENVLLIVHSTQNCFPGRYKSIHVIGMPKFFAYAWNIAYPFILSFKMQNRIFIHGENLNGLHKHFSTAILPEEYGGELGPFDNSAWHSSILERNDWCLEQRLYGYKS